jgi:hypothetical protein
MVRLFHALGAKALVLTNAAGRITPRMTPGSLMLVEDQVSLQWRSPTRPRDPERDLEAADDAPLPAVPPGPRGLGARPSTPPSSSARRRARRWSRACARSVAPSA